MPETAYSSVDFPEPDGPITATISPSSIIKFTFFSTLFRETARRGQDFMRRLGIIDIADNDINEVSGGQLQRACICRSMMNNPKMIFADEPTGALNRTSSDEVMEERVAFCTNFFQNIKSVPVGQHDIKHDKPCAVSFVQQQGFFGCLNRRYCVNL